MQYLALIAALAVALVPTNVWAHGGGLAADGCHNDRKNGGRHCHRGDGGAPPPPQRALSGSLYFFRIVHQHVLRARLLFEPAKPDMAGIWIGMATGSAANNSMTLSPRRMAATLDYPESLISKLSFRISAVRLY